MLIKIFFKVFISDIGLLLAMYPISTSNSLFTNQLDSRKGAIYENLAATMINKCGFPLYYFSNGRDHLEVDFIIESIDGITLIEEKSTNARMAASRNIMEGKSNYKANKCYKVIKENFGVGAFYTSIPQYALPFLLNNMKDDLNKGIKLSKLKYPKIWDNNFIKFGIQNTITLANSGMLVAWLIYSKKYKKAIVQW